MNEEELCTALYKKVAEEQNTYRDWLLSQPPAEILDHAYKYAMQQDMVIELEQIDLSADQARVLLASPSPLEDLYKEFLYMESRQMADIEDCIKGRANDLIKREHDVMRNTPVYPYSAAEAQQRGERDTYFASLKANTACKGAIEQSIRDNYQFNRLDPSAVQQVAEVFGMERMAYVLAYTVQTKNWDTRFSADNRAWAATVPVCENRSPDGSDRNISFLVGAHSGLVDLFVTQTRQEMEHSKERKPSVLKKLQEAKQEAHPTAPKKQKEAER